MGSKNNDEIYTNYSDDKNVLRYSKEGNTAGENNVKSINDLVKSLNRNNKKESE